MPRQSCPLVLLWSAELEKALVFLVSVCMFVSEGTCYSGAGGASRTLSLPTAWLCNSCNSQTRRWGSAPFLSFPPSISFSLSPPSVSLCPGQRLYGIRMEEHLIMSQKVRFNCRIESSFPVFLPYVGLLTNPPPEQHHIPSYIWLFLPFYSKIPNDLAFLLDLVCGTLLPRPSNNVISTTCKQTHSKCVPSLFLILLWTKRGYFGFITPSRINHVLFASIHPPPFPANSSSLYRLNQTCDKQNV